MAGSQTLEILRMAGRDQSFPRRRADDMPTVFMAQGKGNTGPIRSLALVLSGLILTFMARNLAFHPLIALDNFAFGLFIMVMVGSVVYGTTRLRDAAPWPALKQSRWFREETAIRLWIHGLITFILVDQLLFPVIDIGSPYLGVRNFVSEFSSVLVAHHISALLLSACYAFLATFLAVTMNGDMPPSDDGLAEPLSVRWPAAILATVMLYLTVFFDPFGFQAL